MSHPCISYALSQDPVGKTIRLAAIVGFSLLLRTRSELDQFFHRYFTAIPLSHLILFLIAH